MELVSSQKGQPEHSQQGDKLSRAEKDVHSYISNHTCASSISVAGIKHPDKKQLREKGVYLSLELQAMVGWSLWGLQTAGHIISEGKSRVK